MTWQADPGPCPVDDVAHTACTSADYAKAIVIPQLPMRDALAASTLATGEPAPAVAGTAAPAVPGESAPFSTKTYRRPAR